LKHVPIDYIYLSHDHHDHYHPETLKTLDRNAKVLVSDEIDLADSARKLGFEVIELSRDQEVALTDKVKCRILRTHSTNTLMTITDGNETCINLNDALYSAPHEVQEYFIRRLKQIYPKIDYVFCGYGVASHFPNCYIIPGKSRERTAAMRQSHFNREWVRVCHSLQPRFAFPFAADVVFLEDDLFWVNEPTHNSERPTELFRQLHPGSQTEVVDIGPGFCIENNTIVNNRLREQVTNEALGVHCRDFIAQANLYDLVSSREVSKIKQLLKKNLAVCKKYLQEYDGDYRFLIQFRGGDDAIAIKKKKAKFSFDIVSVDLASDQDIDVRFITRLPYLYESLSGPHGDKILFVGSGGIFKYSQSAKHRLGLHRELMVLMRQQTICPRSRYGKSFRTVSRLKRWAKNKKMQGRTERDLYDLRHWTEFSP
jgi:hypothetical protein